MSCLLLLTVFCFVCVRTQIYAKWPNGKPYEPWSPPRWPGTALFCSFRLNKWRYRDTYVYSLAQSNTIPANTTRWNNNVLMLAQRLRRWPNIKTSLFQRTVLAGIIMPSSSKNSYWKKIHLQSYCLLPEECKTCFRTNSFGILPFW